MNGEASPATFPVEAILFIAGLGLTLVVAGVFLVVLLRRDRQAPGDDR